MKRRRVTYCDQIERLEKMLEYMNDHQQASIQKLCDLFCISKAAVNRLAGKNLINIAHRCGYWQRLKSAFFPRRPAGLKYMQNRKAKKWTGQRAASFVEDNDVIPALQRCIWHPILTKRM